MVQGVNGKTNQLIVPEIQFYTINELIAFHPDKRFV